jgi:hypothetical protein
MAGQAMKAALGGAMALALAGCEEVAVTADPGVTGDNPGAARALRACPRAISRQTGTPPTGVRLNTDIVIVEVNQYIFEVDGQERPWTCVTDDAGGPQFLYPTRVIR